MRSLNRTAIIVAVSAILLAAPASAQDVLPWSLEDYPSGGQALTGMVSGTLTAQGDLIVPTCNALKSGNLAQISSGFSGIGIAIADSDAGNAALIIDELPGCWDCREFGTVDRRITLGAEIALSARKLAERDLRYAQEIETVVAMCEDDALHTSYQLARGQDNLGQLIAQEGSDGSPTRASLIEPPIGSGGLASTN